MKRISIILAIILCLSLLALTLVHGFMSSPDASSTDLTDSVVNNWMPLLSPDETMGEFGMGDYRDTVFMPSRMGYVCHGNYVYYRGNSENYTDNNYLNENTILRYDLRNGEVTPACRDADCTHKDKNCPMFLGNMQFYMFQDGMMYFLAAQVIDEGDLNENMPGGIYRYDLATGECKLLAHREIGVNAFLGYYAGKLYYVQYEYQDDAANKNDNIKYIWSCDVESGETQKLFAYDTENGTNFVGRKPMMIDENGRLLFINYIDFDPDAFQAEATLAFEYAELKEGSEIVCVAEHKLVYDSFHSAQTLQYHGGRWYFNARSVEESMPYTLDGKEYEKILGSYAIDYVDFNTGEFGTIIESTTAGFAIAGDYLYYVPYDPFIVEYENGDSVVMRSHGRIVQRHLVTGEEKEFVIDDKYDVGGLRMFCFRGRLFTSVIDYNKDSDRIAVVELDLLTGKYRSVPTKIFN